MRPSFTDSKTALRADFDAIRLAAGNGVIVKNEAGEPMSAKDGGFDHFR